MDEIIISSLASEKEKENRNFFFETFKNCPIPSNELLNNIGIFENRQNFTKKLFFNELYKKIKKVHGIIIEFGCRWGQNLVTLNNLRGIYEPYNYNRKIIGYDTFSGFTKPDDKDGIGEHIVKGSFNVTMDYEKYLQKVLNYHETESPLAHIKKNSIIKGDAAEEFEKYLKEFPETIIAFAYFDFDIYKPTKTCLELLKEHVTRGSIIGFDELNDNKFPGETLAFKEVFKLDRYKIQRNLFSAMQSYIIID